MKLKKFIKKKKYFLFIAAAIFLLSAAGISFFLNSFAQDNPLNPEKPLLLTLWHYRSGTAKAALDAKIEEFNDTVGRDTGIVVEAYSIGNIDSLYEALVEASAGKPGSRPMPDLFTAYTNHAYQIDILHGIVNLENYFTQEELSEYNERFLQHGRIGSKDELKSLPVAKSSECIYLNKTDWDKFSKDAAIDIRILSTWEGILQAAELYYDWSGGNPMWGFQDAANFIQLTAFEERHKAGIPEDTSSPELYYSREAAKKIWKIFYHSLLKGHYNIDIEQSHSLVSMKQGKTLMAIASTGGATYCPTEVWLNETESYPVEIEVLPYPYSENSAKYLMLRGNNFSIAKSDYAHEYAAALFLKWLTSSPHNQDYAARTGYLPVKKASLAEDRHASLHPIVQLAQSTAITMLDEYYCYENPANPESNFMDTQFLENMQDYFEFLTTRMKIRLQNGEDRNQILQDLLSESNFDAWYHSYLTLCSPSAASSQQYR